MSRLLSIRIVNLAPQVIHGRRRDRREPLLPALSSLREGPRWSAAPREENQSVKRRQDL